MAAKGKVQAVVRIQQPGGNANIAKVGQALGAHGVNIVALVKAFNEATAQYSGLNVPSDVIIFEDRSVQVVPKTPATTSLLLRACGLGKGSDNPSQRKVGTITSAQLREVARQKLPDLNTESLDEAEHIVAGSARSMGIVIGD